MEGSSVTTHRVSFVNPSRDTVLDFHIPVPRTGKPPFDSIFLAFFPLFPFLGAGSTTGVVSKFPPQPRQFLQCRPLVVNRRNQALLVRPELFELIREQRTLNPGVPTIQKQEV